jgi:hypothetical protein
MKDYMNILIDRFKLNIGFCSLIDDFLVGNYENVRKNVRKILS